MATMSGMPPMLSLKRSAQSGLKAMTVAWQVIYYEDTAASVLAYLFGGAQIDLTNMQAGDIINLRIRKRMVPLGNLVNHDQLQYLDAQPANHPSVSISGIPNVYGVEIAMQQTAGVLRTLGTEFYDAKRLGLT